MNGEQKLFATIIIGWLVGILIAYACIKIVSHVKKRKAHLHALQDLAEMQGKIIEKHERVINWYREVL